MRNIKVEIRVKKHKERLIANISGDLMAILRALRVKKGRGIYTEITEKALKEYFENHKDEFKQYINILQK